MPETDATAMAHYRLAVVDRFLQLVFAVGVGVSLIDFGLGVHGLRGWSRAVAVVVFAYSSSKAVVAAIGAFNRWPFWTAVLVEGVALAIVGAIVWTQTRETAYVLAAAGLLMGARYWRGRAITKASGDT